MCNNICNSCDTTSIPTHRSLTVFNNFNNCVLYGLTLCAFLPQYVNKNPTRCNSMQIFFTAKSLYMFRVSQHQPSGVVNTVTAASGRGHNTGTAASLQRGLIRPRWREAAVPILWPVPEAATTVFSTPDDGCCDTRNMYSDFAVNKYLHTVASSWIFINTELWCTEPWA